MIHQKANHEEKLQICKKHVTKTCKFRNKCWFLHLNNKSEKQFENILDNSEDESIEGSTDDSENETSFKCNN